MNKEKAKERIKKLKAEILRFNHAYFVLNESPVSEPVRDALKKELIELETAFPEFISPDSPTQRVGAALPKWSTKAENGAFLMFFPCKSLKNGKSAR